MQLVLLATAIVPALAYLVWTTRKMSKAAVDTATQMAALAKELGRLQSWQDEQGKEVEATAQSVPPSDTADESEPSGASYGQPEESLSHAVDQQFETLFPKDGELASALDESPIRPGNQELERETESLKADFEQLESAQEILREDLQQARFEGQRNEQLYLLMKSLLGRHALLQAARDAATKVQSIDTAKPSQKTGSENGSTQANTAPTRPLATENDKNVRNAARIARVMVADLFLYSPKLAEQGNSKAELRKFLKSHYQEARKTFESRVSEQLWKKHDYLEIEFERVLTERTGTPSTDAKGELTTEANPALSPEEREHKNAARVASVLVEDLFLYERETESAATTKEQAHRVLMSRYQDARKTFESRVLERVWGKTDYLEIEFERTLAERANSKGSNADTKLAGPLDAQAVASANDDDAHEAAVRIARLMIADLFLDNWALVEKGVRGDQLREALDAEYQTSRRSFESCIAQSVWKETHYFELQFEQVLLESCGPLVTGKLEQDLRDQLYTMTADGAVASEASRV